MSLGHGASVVRDGLVLHLDAANIKSYPGSGTTWSDLSGNGYISTLVNGTAYTANNSFYFDKSNDSVSVPPINRGINTTIEVVFRTTSVSENVAVRQYIYTQQQNPPIVAAYTYMERQGVMIAGNILQFQYMVEDNKGHTVGSTTILNPNQIYMGAVTLDYDTVVWYINGQETSITRTETDNSYATTNRNAIPVTVNSGKIGLRGDAQGTDYFGGEIFLIRDYNRTLSSTEIKKNFEALRGRYGI